MDRAHARMLRNLGITDMGTGGTDTLARQWLMLGALPRAPRRITASELRQRMTAEGYAISKRSIERDLLHLSALFPIVCDERSRPYGWSWQRDAPDFSVPGMTTLQAVVLMTARAHLKPLLPANQMDALRPLFAQAQRTLAAASDAGTKTSWPDKVAVAPTTQALLPPQVDNDVLVTVHEALYNARQIEIDYLRRGESGPVHYTVHPLGLVQRGPVSYLAVRIGKYTDVRLLAVHRIQRAAQLDVKAVAPRGFKIDSMIPLIGAGFERGKPIHLVMRMADHAAIHLWETPLSTDQEISGVDENGFVTVKATVEDTAQLRWWLLGFGEYVDVLKPANLSRQLCKSHQLAAGYGPVFHRPTAHRNRKL